MNELREKWKKAEYEAIDELIKQIEQADNRYSLSDEYLKEKKCSTREDYNAVEEYPYGIVMVISDYVLPYLKELKSLKEENKMLKATQSSVFREEVYKLQDQKINELSDLLKECQNTFGVRFKADRKYYDDLIKRIEKVI